MLYGRSVTGITKYRNTFLCYTEVLIAYLTNNL